MLVPRAFWRPVGSAVGRAAPGMMRAYYKAVVRSYVSRLARTPQIQAVYSYGSFFGSHFRPGRSDVDLVAVANTGTVRHEVQLLRSLGGSFRRYQGLLPIDLWVIPEGEFESTAAWATAMRPRASEARPARAVTEWKLLAGREVRSPRVREPDERLSFFGDYFVRGPLAAVASRSRPGRTVARNLAELERDARREGLAGEVVQKLADARAALAQGGSPPAELAAAIETALQLVEEHRLKHRIPYERRLSPDADWRVPTPDEGAGPAAKELLREIGPERLSPLRSVTLYMPPFEVAPVLLFESEGIAACGPIIRWAVSGGAARGADRRLSMHILTSTIAEDAWRDGLTCYSIAAGRHVLGDPLAPRLGLPAPRLQEQLLHYLGFWEVATMRWALLGHRTYTRDALRPLRLAALRTVAAGGLPVLDLEGLLQRVPELQAFVSGGTEALAGLDDAAWTALGLEIWRGWPDLTPQVGPAPARTGPGQPLP